MGNMTLPGKADPEAYQRLRTLVLAGDKPGVSTHNLLLMDWNLPKGSCSILAGADGTASLYLSSGGGFLGGGQRHPQLRDAALHATNLGAHLVKSHFIAVEIPADGLFNMPGPGQVGFWWRSPIEVYRALVSEEALKSGRSALAPLAQAMNHIVTLYRTLPMGTPAQP